MPIHFTSDNHFFHKNILRLSHRPFKNLHEMHETLIKNWNDRVKPEEIVYVIGDFSFANHTLTRKITDRLNGYKILIKGNHDMPAHKAILAGFSEVHENIYIDLVAQGGKSHRVFLSHFPYRHNAWKWLKWKIFGGYWDTRYNHKRMVDDGHWLIHGHTHQRYKLKNKMIHVGVDAWDYRPVSHHEIIKLIEDNTKEPSLWTKLLIKFINATGIRKTEKRSWKRDERIINKTPNRKEPLQKSIEKRI